VRPAATGILRGRAAIEEFNRGRLAKSKFLDVVLTTVSLEVVGDLALEVGTNSLLVQTGEAEPVRRTGRHAVVWRLGADGSWRIHVDAPVPDPPK
jgi:ketosteroid isomerase-like protein